MNRKNFYAGQPVTEAELDSAFDDCENGINAFPVARGIGGITSGIFANGASGINVAITAGKAFDNTGRLITVPSSLVLAIGTATGGASTAVVGGANERIVSVFLKFARAASDSRVDGNGNTISFVSAESLAWVIRVGTEALAGTAQPPALESDGVLICDVILAFAQTNIAQNNISLARRQDYINRTGTEWLNWEPVSLAAYGTTGVGTSLRAGAVGGYGAVKNPRANQIFVATTSNHKILSSYDGRVWTERYYSPGNWQVNPTTIQHVFWSQLAQKFLVGGNGITGNELLSSPDGITWTARTVPLGNTLEGFAESNSIIVLGDVLGSRFYSSPDGITWTARTNPSGDSVLQIVWNGSIFVALTLTGRKVTSPDGITWTDRGDVNATPSYSLRGLVWNGSVFIHTCGTGSGTRETSPDGITWTLQPATVDLDGVAVNVLETVLVGTTMYGMTHGRDAIVKSEDYGATWDVHRLSAGMGNGFFKAPGRLVCLGAINALPGLLLGQRYSTTK